MTNVVTLRNEPVSVSVDAVPEVVELLRELLAQAERGDLRSVAVIVETMTETRHFVRPAKISNHLVAAVALCKHDILTIGLANTKDI